MYTTTIIHIEEQEQITYNRLTTIFFGSRKFQTRSEIFRVREMNGCQPMCNIQGKTRAMINHTQLNTTIPIFIIADFSVPKLIRQETSVCFRNKFLQQTGQFIKSTSL